MALGGPPKPYYGIQQKVFCRGRESWNCSLEAGDIISIFKKITEIFCHLRISVAKLLTAPPRQEYLFNKKKKEKEFWPIPHSSPGTMSLHGKPSVVQLFNKKKKEKEFCTQVSWPSTRSTSPKGLERQQGFMRFPLAAAHRITECMPMPCYLDGEPLYVV